MMSISTLAADARESLKDEKQLVQTFEVLRIISWKETPRSHSLPTIFSFGSHKPNWFEIHKLWLEDQIMHQGLVVHI